MGLCISLLFLAAILCRLCSGLSTAENDLLTVMKAFARNEDAYSTFVSLLPVHNRMYSNFIQRLPTCKSALITGACW